tara:strand:+ start:743 stop:1399 length:657 start_codon:yes stop_codon:yes gene_type:complete
VLTKKNYRIFGRTKSRTSNKLNLEKYSLLKEKYNIKKMNKKDNYILDIGSGYGETSIYFALNNNKSKIISCDKYINGNFNLLKKIESFKLLNSYIFTGNVIEFLDLHKKTKYFSKVAIFFPDPWPKKKHLKRRLINEIFLNNLYIYLKDNAEVYIATDSQPYTTQILNCIYQLKKKYRWINSKKMHLDIKDFFDFETKFYKKAINFGHIPSLFILKKI